ncbi:MAG TPA: GntG family PLP-dependent aldolase [Polyangiaceae bacterium]|nr:GntG family PLP-dependent aldolase [Polyangiaceae bacterium]
METIDLRSDTVTRPSEAMRRAMASAEVGDDVFGEDPTVRALEERVAELLGKQRALFVPSGTMSNQLALLSQTQRGDEIVVGEGAHLAWFESGAAAALSGIQHVTAGSGGLYDAADLLEHVKPTAYYFPRTRIAVLENTHNRSGGRVFPLAQQREVSAAARKLGLRVHLDGARLWNAMIASGESLAQLASVADTVSVCFSKGLGAPLGSALVGPADTLTVAHRYRRMLGGAMRQAGIVAAAALFALDNNMNRLVEDHDNARAFADLLSTTPGVTLDPELVQTNIVNVVLESAAESDVVERAAGAGVLVTSIAPRTLRAVFHLDVSSADAERAAKRLGAVIQQAPQA